MGVTMRECARPPTFSPGELWEDQCLSVACSSMISRYIFLKEMDKLSNSIGINLPKGANPLVDEVGKKIVSMYGKDKLREIAKLNFKNTDKILN